MWHVVAMLALLAIVVLVQRYRLRRESSQDRHILTAAEKYGVDPARIKAVVWRESWFDSLSRSARLL